MSKKLWFNSCFMFVAIRYLIITLNIIIPNIGVNWSYSTLVNTIFYQWILALLNKHNIDPKPQNCICRTKLHFAFNVITDSVILCETANVENALDKTKINHDPNEKRVHILRAV